MADPSRHIDEATGERIHVIQESMSGLRNEVFGYLASSGRLQSAVLAGLAGVIVLRPAEEDVSLFLPLLPVIGAALVALRANVTYETWLAGWSLAIGEAKINYLAGSPLLQHELEYWDKRHQSYIEKRQRRAVTIALLLAGVVYGVVTVVIWLSSDLRSARWAWIAFALLATGAYGALCYRLAHLMLFASDPNRNAVIKDAETGNFHLPGEDTRIKWLALTGTDKER